MVRAITILKINELSHESFHSLFILKFKSFVNEPCLPNKKVVFLLLHSLVVISKRRSCSTRGSEEATYTHKNSLRHDK